MTTMAADSVTVGENKVKKQERKKTHFMDGTIL